MKKLLTAFVTFAAAAGAHAEDKADRELGKLGRRDIDEIAVFLPRYYSQGTTQSAEYWTDPDTGEIIEILKVRPIPVPTWTPDRFMLIDH
jgi:hypothetical protein